MKTEGKQFEYLKWVIVIAIVYLLYKVIKGFSKLTSGGDFPEVTESLDSELIALKNKGINPTINESTALSYADFIYNTNMGFNTDEEGIIDVFRVLNNQADLILLKKAFGTRRPQFETSYMGLAAFLRSDLSNSEINTINEILAQKRIQSI